MGYEAGPDGFLRPTGGVRTNYRPTSPPSQRPPEPRPNRSTSGLVIALLILVVLVAVVIVAKYSGTGFVQNSSPGVPQSQPGAQLPALPADSETLPATGYISALNASITRVAFYESSADTVPPGYRVYSSAFGHDSTKYINWELSLQHPSHSARQNFVIIIYLYNPDGNLRTQQQSPTYIEPSWTNSSHSNRWGQESEEWPSGMYRVSFFVDGVKVGVGSFVINAPPPSPQVAETPTDIKDADASANPVDSSPEPTPAPKSPPTVEDCAKERRLTSLRTLDSIESWTLERVKGSCEALNLPLREDAPKTDSSKSEWRRFGENQDRSQTNEVSSVEEAKLTKRVSPTYPALAKQARVQGVVRLSATVGVDGKLHNIRVISGSPLLSGAAVAATEQWRYSPARLHGSPIESPATIEVNFTLGEH